MRRRLFLLPLYGLFFLAAFVVFAWLTIPWDRVKDKLVGELEAGTGYEVRVGGLDSYWLTGIEVTDLVMKKPLTPAQKKAREEQRAYERRKAQEAKGGGADGAGEAKDGGQAQGGEAKGPEVEGGEAKGQEEGGEEDPEAAKRKAIIATIPKPIRIPHLHVRVALLPLMLGKLALDFGAELAGGELEGRVGLSGDAYFYDLEAHGLRIQAIPMVGELLPVPLRGRLSLEGEGTYSPTAPQESRGELELRLDALVLDAGEIPLPKGAMFPSVDMETPTKLGKLVVFLVMGKEQARDEDAVLVHVERFEHSGGDLQLKLEGDILLKKRLASSRIDMTLGVKFADPFVERNHLKMVLDNRKIKRNMKDGFLGINLRGALTKPQPRMAKPTWGKSRGYLRAGKARGAKKPAGSKKARRDEKR